MLGSNQGFDIKKLAQLAARLSSLRMEAELVLADSSTREYPYADAAITSIIKDLSTVRNAVLSDIGLTYTLSQLSMFVSDDQG